MPQVPYQPYPNVSPQEGAEQIGVATPGAAFGENIGRAVQGLGQTEEQAGGEVFQRAIAIQDIANETEARQADANYAKDQGMLHADFVANNLGKDARAALPKFLQDSDQLRQKYRSGLNPAAQRLFDASSLGFLIRNVNSAAIHAGSEFKSYVVGEAQATQHRAATEYVDPEDDEEVQANNDRGRAAVMTEAQSRGWGPEKTQDALETFNRGQRVGQITMIANQGNVPKAWEMYQDALDKGQLSEQAAEKLQQHIWNENEKRASKIYVDKIFSPDKSDADMARDVEQMVNDPKINLGDPQFGIMMRHALEFRIREANQQQRMQKSNDLNVVQSLVNRGASSYSEVSAVPEGQAALESLERNNPKEFNSIKKNISVWAGHRDWETEQRSMNVLQNISREDPNRFLSVDLYDPNLKLSTQDREHWLNVRDRLLKNNGTAVKDPIVSQGINYIQSAYAPQMKAAGLVNDQGRRVKDDNWDSFWGYVDTSIRDYQTQNKKQPDKTALDEIAKEAFVNHSEPRFMQWLIGPSQVPEYKRSFTEAEQDAARKELRRTNPGQEPNDLQVRRWLIQKQWNEFHQGGAKSEEAGSAGGPTAPRSQ